MMYKLTNTDTHNLMNCSHLMEEGIALAVDALRIDRFEDLPESIRIHLSECQECRLVVMELYQVMESIDENSLVEEPPFFASEPVIPYIPASKPSQFWLKMVAAVSLLLLSMGIARFNNVPRYISEMSRYLATTKDIGAQDPYRLDPMMEPLTNMIFRGSKIKILSPITGDSLIAGKPILFNWTNQESVSITLSLQNNRGKTIAKMEVFRGSLLLDSLSPGLYYWKLESENELLYLGSFVVGPG